MQSNNLFRSYTLQDYISIKELNNPYILPKETVDIISYVSNMVGSPNYVKTPQFLLNNETDKKKKKRNKNNELSAEDWEAIRNFKATEKNEKVGIEKIIDDIKGEINKIADKNYTLQKNIIIEKLSSAILLCDKDQLSYIGTIIVDISSSNRFFSKLYTNLVIEILKMYDFIIPIVNNEYNNIELSIRDMSCELFSTSEDYEILCNKNKQNELRRSKILFFVHLMKMNYIEERLILSIINTILVKIYNNIDNPNAPQLVEELSELLFIIIKESYDVLKKNHEEWNNIYQKIEAISEMKSNDKGITNKTIFKQMDLLDIINTT
tara:strand:+ start:13 stop:978 length:966 start_codon:yes stop_codon:yes gene_type:complete